MNRRALIRGIGASLIYTMLVGCSTLSSQREIFIEPLTEGQIRKLMSKNNISGFSELVLDDKYTIVTIDWLKSVYCPELKREIKDNNLKYTPQSQDCDNFSNLGRYIASKLNSNGRNNAIGEFFYKADKGFSHAINFAIIRGFDNELELVFIEPQNPSIVRLSKNELNSCLAWII
jgi:hypothetical protein